MQLEIELLEVDLRLAVSVWLLRLTSDWPDQEFDFDADSRRYRGSLGE